MSCEVKGILASRNPAGVVLSTLQLRYWRGIHAELMTHRAFSRNAGSSRATPVKRVLAQVWSDPAGPTHWGANQPGMQAAGEVVGWRRATAKFLWRSSGKAMCVAAWGMMKLGLHKQVANRLLEPWQYINVLVSSTDWDNFYKLRCHPDAQPEFQDLAVRMRDVLANMPQQDLLKGQWHLPYTTRDELEMYGLSTTLKMSSARCARISVAPFDGNASIDKEVARHDLLVGSDPIHASPTEHQGQAMVGNLMMANMRGFIQQRHFIEQGVKL